MSISSAKIAKAIFFIAFLVILPTFLSHDRKWATLSEISVFFSFFYTGAFFTFASEKSITEYWGKDSRLGLGLADPTNGKNMLLIMRGIGIAFMIGMLWIAFWIALNILHQR